MTTIDRLGRTISATGTTPTTPAPITADVAIKTPCRVATTANISLIGEQTIDGVAAVAGDRILVKNQTAGAENGIYVCASGAWSRATDCNANSELVNGTIVHVYSGSAAGNMTYELTFSGALSIGTTALTFTRSAGIDPVSGIVKGNGSGSFSAAGADTDYAAPTITQSGTGAAARTLTGKAKEIVVSVKDFGAVGDGTTNDTTAIQNAINSGATNIYFPAGTYKVTSTVTISKKVGIHIFGDSGGSNGLGSSKIYWAGAANGVIFEIYSSSHCTVERLALQGVLGGTPTNPGTGFYVTAINADGASHWNVIRDCTVAAIGGTPGYGILLGSGTNDDIATNTFENILIVGGTVGVVQFGNQTVNNFFKNVQLIDYTSKGMEFIDGDVRLDKCSFFGTTTATADCEIGTGTLWATVRDSYHEILDTRPAGAIGYSFPTGTRAYPTRLDSVRVLWNRASGTVINYLQNGPLTIADHIFDGTGTGTVTVTNGATTAQRLEVFGYKIATITYSFSGPGAGVDGTFLTAVKKGVNFNSANTDTQLPIYLPAGFTRFRLLSISISGASQTLTTATGGLFTAASGGGTAIVTGGSAITVSTASENTNNNTQAMTINNLLTETYNVGSLYFRVGTAQGAAATGDVTIYYIPMP